MLAETSSSGFVWLESVILCKTEATARATVNGCAMMDMTRVRALDMDAHSRGRLLTMLVEALSTEQHSSVAHCVCTNGTTERFVKDIIKTSQAIFNEDGWCVSRWVQVISVVQWALNSAVRSGTAARRSGYS